MKSKKDVACVTGSHGFLGTHLVKYLYEKNIEVIVISREILLEVRALKTFLELHNPHYIFHLAAYGNHANQTDDTEKVNVNYGGTYNMLAASKNIHYKAFINVSSSSVLLPHETFYSASKAGAERLCRAFAYEYEKPVITCRPYSLYGPNEASFRFIPTVFRSCLEGEPIPLASTPVHDWLYVQSFVEGMWKCAQRGDKLSGKSFNFGTGIGTSNAEIVSLIEKITGKKARIVDKLESRSYDTTDWICKQNSEAYVWSDEHLYTLEEGLRKYYASII